MLLGILKDGRPRIGGVVSERCAYKAGMYQSSPYWRGCVAERKKPQTYHACGIFMP